jgi:hypothetical protein
MSGMAAVRKRNGFRMKKGSIRSLLPVLLLWFAQVLE